MNDDTTTNARDPWDDDDGHVAAEVLYERLKANTNITRGKFRRTIRRMVRSGRARIYFVDGNACVRLTSEGREWLKNAG